MKKSVIALFFLVFAMMVTAGCGNDNDITKVELVPQKTEVKTLDLHWPGGSTITYDAEISSSTHYYYLREGSSLKEYDSSYICNRGYDPNNNPNWNTGFYNRDCEKSRIGTSPYHVAYRSFSGNIDFNIYGKVDEDFGSCPSGCNEKKVYYMTSLQLLGDQAQKDIYQNAWFYDSNQGKWIYRNNFNNSNINYNFVQMRSFFIDISPTNFFVVNSTFINNMNGNNSLGSMPYDLRTFISFFNVGKYQPWKDSAWPLFNNSVGIGVYKGRDRFEISYNGKQENITVYKVDMYTTYNSGDKINDFLQNCANSSWNSTYNNSTTSSNVNTLCTYAIFPMGYYYWSGENILMKEEVTITSVNLLQSGYDCIYIDNAGNARRVVGSSLRFDANGNINPPFDNCVPDSIKKFITYRVATSKVIIQAVSWNRK